MPALTPNTPAKVLVTGATGYIGQWVLRSVLDRGHTARVVVRSEAKAKAVKDVFPKDVGKLEFAVIPDISKVSFDLEWGFESGIGRNVNADIGFDM